MHKEFLRLADPIFNNRIILNNIGLMNGNLGISIFFYHLARIEHNPAYEKFADELLENIIAKISLLTTEDFENGVAGIGWGIEYLVQNKFAQGDTDEILQDIDSKIFCFINNNKHTSFELTNGLTGFLFYLNTRLRDREIDDSLSCRINLELAIHIINTIDELVTKQFPMLVKEVSFDLAWQFPVVLIALEDAYRLNIHRLKIECMLRQWLPYFEAYIPSLNINRIYLSLALKRICNLWPERRIERQINILLYATEFEMLNSETNLSFLNVRYGWPGVALILKKAYMEFNDKYPNYSLIGQSYFSLIQKQKRHSDNNEKNVQYGIATGVTGVGLIELLYPGILNGDK